MFNYLAKFRKRFPDRKFFGLIDKIYNLDNLEIAWKKAKANKGSAGVDKETLSDFMTCKNQYFNEIGRAIKSNRYQPTPVLRKLIPKSDGKLRPLGIPTVKDRVLQQATLNVLEPIFEMKFHNNSFGFRPNKSAHQAIEQIQNYLKDGYTWIIDADIKGFFDAVDHKLLMSFLNKEISDGKVLNLIESWLKAGVFNNGILEETPIGTPQGGVISPLLANIYLHELDIAIASNPYVEIVRYADDFIILCKYKIMAESMLEQVKVILEKLKLELHPTKSRIVNTKTDTFEFLGFIFNNRLKFIMKPRDKSIQKFKDSVRLITKRSSPTSPKKMVGILNWTIRGWGNYFKIGTVKTLFTSLDCWLRLRVRCFIEKKISRFANQRLPKHVLKSEYKLVSLSTLVKSRSL